MQPNQESRPAMRILVVEDNRDITANLGDYLEERGHTVDYAADGVTGLHLAVVNNFDAIVLDINLSGFDSGADDYLVKPFALQEVEARLQVLARRGKAAQPRILEVADLE